MDGGGVEGGVEGGGAGGAGGTAIGGVATEIFDFFGLAFAPPETDTPPVPDTAVGGGGGGGGGSLKKPATVSGIAS